MLEIFAEIRPVQLPVFQSGHEIIGAKQSMIVQRRLPNFLCTKAVGCADSRAQKINAAVRINRIAIRKVVKVNASVDGQCRCGPP